ncbi:MAG: hypothetical protein HY906_17680 [Deltaproteobacteria bacterium]|nr:hypothetical protein [Deltaproteobacteria bacterium]
MSDEQTEILRGIWQELKDLGKNLGDRIDRTNQRLDETRDAVRAELAETRDALRAELAETRRELSARIDGTNTRLDKVEEALRELAAQQLMLTRYVGTVVDRHEQAIADLRERLGRLEGAGAGH